MSNAVKVFPSPRVDTKSKYEITDVEDNDRFDPNPSNMRPCKSPQRRVSGGSFAAYQDSPSLAKQRRKSLSGPTPSPRASRQLDQSASNSKSRSSFSTLEDSAYSHLTEQSPSSGSRKSALTPTSRRSSRTTKKKVIFRNPIADVILPDNSITQSQVEGTDYSLAGDDHSSGSSSRRRRRRRAQEGVCCNIS